MIRRLRALYDRVGERAVETTLAAWTVAAIIAVAATIAMAACGARDDRPPGATAPRKPAGRPAPPASPQGQTVPVPRNAAAERPERLPTGRDAAAARRVAERFTRAWVAYNSGQGPLAALRDAPPGLRDRLATAGGGQPAGPAAPVITLTGLERQRAANPRLLVAAMRIRGASPPRARLLLAWAVGRWRVIDLRAAERRRRFLAKLPYRDRRVAIVLLESPKGQNPIVAVIPRRGGGEQAIRHAERLIRRSGDDPGSYTIRFGGE